MSSTLSQPELVFPFEGAPEPGALIDVAPGIAWLRMQLPFLLDHVNVYLIEDDDGWLIVDTGIASEISKEAWEYVLSHPMRGRRIKGVFATHYHPDHIGLAGWLCERLDVPLYLGQMSYLMTTNISLRPGSLESGVYRDLYLRNGASSETADVVSSFGHGYLRMVSPLPPTFIRVTAGDTWSIGGRSFEVMSGDGHAPEQLMLYCEAENLFLAADQVIEKITPNIGVWPEEPEGDPLGLYMRSLREIPTRVTDNALVLPGHRLPFRGLHARCRQIADHHEHRCELIADSLAGGPRIVAELVPVLFRRELDPHQMSFAFGETLAHVNYMARQGSLFWDRSGDVRTVVGRP